jgi:hypothetical protein
MLGPSPTILDTGASDHYFSIHTNLPNKRPTRRPVTVQVANNQTMQSTHTATLPIPQLPKTARTVHLFPDMTTNLIAVAPLTKAGCQVTFSQQEAVIQCPDSEPIHCPATPQGIWEVPMALFAQQQDGMAMATIGNSNGPADIVAFHHAALFSPSISTLNTAMKKGYLPPLPGLTEQSLKRHPPDAQSSTMGHLDNRRKNIQSTKQPQQPDPDQETVADIYPDQPTSQDRTHHCYLAVTEPKSLVYTDQTGSLPVTSSTGNNYLLIGYDYDSNNILFRPIKNRTAEAITAAIADVHTTLSLGGCKPKFHRLDNECPQQVKDYFNRREVKYQLAPPPTTTEPTQPREPSARAKTTSQPDGGQWTKSSPSTFGIKPYHTLS